MTLAGIPTTSDPSEISLPSRTSAPAPTTQFVADLRAVHHGRAHADQAVRTDGAAVENGAMADGAALADRERKAHVGVEDAMFLDIAARADGDALIVAAQHGAKPDADFVAERDLADHARIGRNPVSISGRNVGPKAVERVQGHGGSIPDVLGEPRARAGQAGVDTMAAASVVPTTGACSQASANHGTAFVN
jgi:hypothetical protein